MSTSYDPSRLRFEYGDEGRKEKGPRSLMVASAKQPEHDEATAAIIKGERLRIAAELRKAVSDAVPEEPMAYIQGFRDGADFVAQRVLGLVVTNTEPQG